jgi:hypothetical protein
MALRHQVSLVRPLLTPDNNSLRSDYHEYHRSPRRDLVFWRTRVCRNVMAPVNKATIRRGNEGRAVA